MEASKNVWKELSIRMVTGKAKRRERDRGFRSKNLKRNQEKKMSFLLSKPTSAVGPTAEIHKRLTPVFYNIAKKLIKTRYMADRYPQDFCGAASRRIELVYLSSDEEEEMDTLSTTSVMDLQLSSEDEEYDDEILMMAQCVEMQLSKPIPVPGPSTSKTDRPSL